MRWPEEVEALLTCAIESDAAEFTSAVLYTVLGLLATTGLRASEALGLDRSDVMPQSNPNTLLIREAKFHKTRIVPLHPSTAGQIQRYAAVELFVATISIRRPSSYPAIMAVCRMTRCGLGFRSFSRGPVSVPVRVAIPRRSIP
jgi:integrase